MYSGEASEFKPPINELAPVEKVFNCIKVRSKINGKSPSKSPTARICFLATLLLVSSLNFTKILLSCVSVYLPVSLSLCLYICLSICQNLIELQNANEVNKIRCLVLMKDANLSHSSSPSLALQDLV